MMMDHRWQKGHLDGQCPEEDGRGYFQLPEHVLPFLAIVREKTRDQSDRVRKQVRGNLLG